MKKLIVLVVMVLSSAHAFAWDWNNSAPSSASAGDYGRGSAMVSGSAMEGVIVNARFIRIEASTTAMTTGRTAGAAIGAIVGNGISNNNGRMVATVLGGLAGGLVGDAVSNRIADTTGQELIVRLKDGRMIVVTQGGDDRFATGDNVYIVSMNGNTRIVRA